MACQAKLDGTSRMKGICTTVRIPAGKVWRMAFAMAAFCGAMGAWAEPTDGFYWPMGWYHHLDTFQSQLRYWEGNIVPSDGGVAYWTGPNAGDIKFGSSVTLRGLDFGNVQLASGSGAEHPRILTTGLTLAGDDAFIRGTGRGTSTSGQDRYALVNATVSGTGANTLTIKGPGFLTVNTPFANFGTVALSGGDAIVSATNGRLLATGGTTALRGGVLRWAPSLAAGASGAASLGAVTYGLGFNELRWLKGNGVAATLTIDSLASEGVGSTLWIRPSGGTSALGDTEKLIVTTPPALVNGIIDPGVVAHDEATESAPLSFLTYDAVNGVVPYPTASLVPLADATATDVAVLSASNTLENSKQVAALVVDNSALLAISNGVTLKVGDNNSAHQAGVILNRQVGLGTDKALVFEGEGTLDFGASPGVIWSSSPTIDGWGANRAVAVKTKITGQNGVTFASHGVDGTNRRSGFFYIYSGYCNWSGPTRVSGTFLWVYGQDALPAGDVYVVDGDSSFGAQIRPESAWTFNQNFFLSGSGHIKDGTCVFYLPNGNTSLKGVVTLVGDSAFGCRNAGQGGVLFHNEVRGPGSLIVWNGGTYHFYATNSFDMLDVSGATTINVCENGTLGRGRVWLRGGSTSSLNFSEVPSLVVTNEFRQDGGTLAMSLKHSKASITKDVKVTSLSLNNFSELAIGGAFDAGALKATGGRDNTEGTEQIKACAAGATLGVGDATDSMLGIPLSDGTGTLGLTKKGTGTVELPPVERTYSGPTKVASGTLKLNDNPLLSKSLAYWLDASCEEDFEKDAETGVITKWNSHGGKAGYYFSVAAGAPTWGTEEKVNGLNVVTTKKADGATPDRLVASGSAEHRTVFVVYRARTPVNMGGILGGNGTDIGLRMATSSNPTSWDVGNFGSWTIHTRAIRRDGESGSAIDFGNPHILTLVHDRDDWKASVSWGGITATCNFTPAIGWYNGTGRYYGGDYCEVLAFDRVLTEREMRIVENYLSEKWLNRTIWNEIEATPALLPSGTALTVETGATLDLAGCSATVASLSGNGTITNSSETAATLTVTGGGSFTGHVGGKATLAMGADAAAGAVVTEGATLAATGGTLATGMHVFTPPTNGLAYWCDAGQRDTILLNDSNQVTGWVSRAASSSAMLVNTGAMPNNNDSRTKPVYAANKLGGKPCIEFVNGRDALWSNAKTPVRTMFIVTAANGGQSRNCAALWGITGIDRGFRFSNNSTTIEGGGGGVRFTGPKDWVSLDGERKDAGGLALWDATVRVIGARMDPANHTEAYFRDELGLGTEGATRATILGNYCGNQTFVGYVGEVIAYDRALSDGEMKQVENYLIAKWETASWTEGNPPAESEQGLAGGTLSVASGASATVASGTSVGILSGAGTLVGDVTADGFDVTVKPDGATDTLTVNGTVTLDGTAYLRVNNPENLQNGVSGIFLQATGIVGRFADSNLEKPNGWSVTSTKAKVFRISQTVLIFR